MKMPAGSILLAGNHYFLASHLWQVVVSCACPIQVCAHGLKEFFFTRGISDSSLTLNHGRAILALLGAQLPQPAIMRLVHLLGVI